MSGIGPSSRDNDWDNNSEDDDHHDDVLEIENENIDNGSGSNDDNQENVVIEDDEPIDQVLIPDLVPDQNFEQEPQPGVNPEQLAPGAAVAPIQDIEGKESFGIVSQGECRQNKASIIRLLL